jgi:hypothetical protein
MPPTARQRHSDGLAVLSVIQARQWSHLLSPVAVSHHDWLQIPFAPLALPPLVTATVAASASVALPPAAPHADAAPSPSDTASAGDTSVRWSCICLVALGLSTHPTRFIASYCCWHCRGQVTFSSGASGDDDTSESDEAVSSSLGALTVCTELTGRLAALRLSY